MEASWKCWFEIKNQLKLEAPYCNFLCILSHFSVLWEVSSGFGVVIFILHPYLLGRARRTICLRAYRLSKQVRLKLRRVHEFIRIFHRGQPDGKNGN